MPRIVLLLALLLSGCAAEMAGSRLRDIGAHAGGQLLLIDKTDFPNGDVRAGAPSTAGSAALQDAVIADDGVDAFVRAHGIPDAMAIESMGLTLHFAYLAESRVYTLEHSAAEAVSPRAIHDSTVTAERAMTEGELDLVDPERRTTRQAEAVRTLVGAHARVQTLGRLMVLALPPGEGPPGESYGVLLLHASPATQRLYGIDQHALDERVVAWVNPAGPFGGRLLVGDRVTAINGTSINVVEQSGGLKTGGARRLTVQRGDERMEIEAQPERWPRSVVFEVVPIAEPNAAAREGMVAVTLGLLELVPDDDALAFVIGHELAHITAGHVERKVTPGSLLQGLVAVGVLLPAEIVVPGSGQLLGSAMQGVANRFNRDQERDADRLGLRYSHASGYDPQAAVAFITLMEEKAPVGGAAQFFDIHPPYPERRELLQTEIGGLGRAPSREGEASPSRADDAGL